LPIDATALEHDPEPDAMFGELSPPMSEAANYKEWDKQLRRWLSVERALVLYRSTALGETSRSGESERGFRIRLQQLGNERRDMAAAQLKQKYATKFATLNARELRAMQARDRQQEQARDAKISAAVSVGTAVLGALFGRGRSRGSASQVGTAVRRTGSISRETSDVRRAEETIGQVQADRQALELQFQKERDALAGSLDAQNELLKQCVVRPKAGDIEVRFLGVGWIPLIEDATGQLHPL
jgi:hypothetical protein